MSTSKQNAKPVMDGTDAEQEAWDEYSANEFWDMVNRIAFWKAERRSFWCGFIAGVLACYAARFFVSWLLH